MSRFRKSGSEGTSALLQKVNSQLRGEKPTEDDDEGLGAYLSNLGKGSLVKYKPKQSSIDWGNFEELSEKSSTSDDDERKQKQAAKSPGSKFLKKKPQSTPGSDLQTGKAKPQPTSSALSKASKFSSQYESKPRPELVRMLSDSDMDISLSADNSHIQLGDAASLIPATKPRSRSRTPEKSASDKSDSMKKDGSRFMKKATVDPPPVATPQPKPAQPVAKSAPLPKKTPDTTTPARSQVATSAATQKSQFRPAHTAIPAHVQDDTDSSSMSIGKGGSRFLKKKAAAPVEKPDSPKSPKIKKKDKVNKKATNEKRDQFTLRSSLKYGTEVQLDTSEESLADYIHNLDGGSSGSGGGAMPAPMLVPNNKAKRTPRTPSRSATLLDEIKEEDERRMDATLSDDDSYKKYDHSYSDSLASTVLHLPPDPDDTSYCEDEVNVFDVDALEPLDIASSYEIMESRGKSPRQSSPKPSSPKSPVGSQRSRSSKSSGKSKKKITKQKAVTETKATDDFFSNFGLQTVEDLLGPSIGANSEIGTDIEDESRDDRSPSPLRSILSPSPKPVEKTPRTSRSRVHYSLEEITEIRSRSPSPMTTSRRAKSETAIYTESFEDMSQKSESSIRTEQPTSDVDSISEHVGSLSQRSARSRLYSDDFVSATESRWSSSRRDMKRTESVETTVDYSDDFSDASESATEHSRRPRSSGKKKSVEVQTMGQSPADLLYQWDERFVSRPIVPPGLGLGQVDPSPIARHVVSADALEAVTGYSPSVLALNDMLRMQLALTQNFIEIQKHLHQNLIAHAQPDYTYTTLQDTKEYIRRHRKPRLTFKEALRQVKEDMGIQ